MKSYFAFTSEALALIKPSSFITPLYYLSIVKINAYVLLKSFRVYRLLDWISTARTREFFMYQQV
jgi:hypothetical protein